MGRAAKDSGKPLLGRQQPSSESDAQCCVIGKYTTLRPPCLFDDDEGLQPSVLLPPNAEVVAIEKNRNAHSGHNGDMASWQMRGVNF